MILSLALSTSLAYAGTTLSAPAMLPGDAAIGQAAGTQDQPFITEGDGATWLMVWRDTRSNLADTQGGITTDVWGMRVDADGTPLDPVSFPIASGPWNEDSPRAAWNGSEWLVAFDAEAPTPGYWGQGVFASRVAADGTLLDAEALTVADDTSDTEALWDVASDGVRWATLYQGVNAATGTYSLFGATIESGGVVGPEVQVFAPSSGLGAPWNAQVAWGTDRYMVVWSAWGNDDDVYVLPIDADLASLSGPVAVEDGGASAVFPTIAAGDDGFYVAWFDNTFGAYWTTVMGTPIDADGVSAVPDGETLSGETWPLDVHPESAWTGSNWATVWEYGAAAEVYASFADLNGQFTEMVNVTADLDYYQGPTAATGVDGALVGWATYGDMSDFNVEASTLATDGGVGQVADVSLAAPAHTHPAMALGNGEYMVVAESQTADVKRIVAWRTDAWGLGTEDEPLELAVGTAVDDPAVAWNGDVWFVAWSDTDPVTAENGIVGVRIDADGTVLDSPPIALMAGYRPAVASNTAGDFLVAGSVPITYDGHTQDLYGVRVSGDGVLLDTTYIVIGSSFAVGADIAAHGTGWLVTWSHFWSHDSGSSEAMYNVVSATGVPTGQSQVRTVGSIAKETDVNVASDGTIALVVWSDSGNIRGRRISSTGALLGKGAGIVISSATNEQFDPDVAWYGSAFYVAWTDYRAHALLEPGEGDVYMSKVTRKGVVSNPTGVVVANSDAPEGGPVVAGVDGRAVFAWTALHDEAPYGAFRIDTAWIGTGPDPVGAKVASAASTAREALADVTGCSTAPAGAVGFATLLAALLARRRAA
jgi:hypothetical protein